MSLQNVFDITASGMTAQTIRMRTIASNMANAESVATEKENVFKPKSVIFESASFKSFLDPINEKSHVGVSVTNIIDQNVEPIQIYAPHHPLANEDGYIFQSEVNLMNEMADMISASRSYQNNIEVFNTTKNMLIKTLQLGAK
jgi:flagellar basal-body rod protein FlgC